MASNYDNSAWFYDSLSRLIYGKALIKAQVYLLQYVLPNTSILIVGGGTGWILEELTRIHPSGLEITYIEISENMTALSRKRNVGANQVNFISQPVEDVSMTQKFDVIITPFLFDNFTEKTLNKVFNHLNSLLKTNGIWLNTDFQLTGRWWQNWLLKAMFLFFKICCNIEASVLPDTERQFNKNGYSATAQKLFFGDFITSKVFKRNAFLNL